MVGSQVVCVRQRALQITSSLRRQAVSATLDGLPAAMQALVEGLDAGVVAGGRQRGHIERGAHLARGRPSSGGARAGRRCRG